MCCWIPVCMLSGCDDDEPVDVNINLYIEVLTPEEQLMFDMVLSDDFEVESHTTSHHNLEIYDAINDITWKYSVVLPSSYSSEKSYPFLYLLHGRDAHNESWFGSLQIDKTLDYFYSLGFPETVVVMPYASNTY